MNRLTVFYEGRYGGIYALQLTCREIKAFPAVGEHIAVIPIGGLCIIEELAEGAFSALRASVADIRRTLQSAAMFFLKLRTEVIAERAACTAASTIGLVGAKTEELTASSEKATIRDIAEGTHIALLPVLLYLPADGGSVFAEILCDLGYSGSIVEKKLDLDPVVQG